MGAWEIARMFGVSRQAVHQWIDNPRQEFPKPVARLHMGLVWRADDVAAWARKNGRPIRGDEILD